MNNTIPLPQLYKQIIDDLKTINQDLDQIIPLFIQFVFIRIADKLPGETLDKIEQKINDSPNYFEALSQELC